MARWIAGLDGCRGAWAGVLLDLDDPERHRAVRFARVADLMDGPETPGTVGIDVPIGLPERTTGGGRSADQAARRLLGAGRASVFPVPPRAALEATDYATAKALARANSDPPRAVSIQCFNILGYVREVDRLLRARPGLERRLHEVRPEVAFHRLNGDRRLGAVKTDPAGLDERRGLLVRAGLPPSLVASDPPRGIGRADHVDAMAALLVAREIAGGRALPLPDPPDRDAFGLPIVIWAPGGACDATLAMRLHCDDG